jgi:predicted ABC-type sugar transport system permease subunit
VVTDPDETRILEDMESEHASLDPRVERIDAAIAGPSSAALASERLLAGRDGDVRRPVGFLILGLIVATIITPDFIRLSNIDSLLVDNSSLLVIAVGEAFVIMVGSIDLGVESILVSAGMLIAWLTVFHGMPSGLAIVMTLAAAVVIGLLVGCWWPRCTFPPSWSRSASTGASAVSPC